MIAATKLKRKNPKGYATAGVSPVRRSVEPAARARAVKKNTQAVPAVIRPMAIGGGGVITLLMDKEIQVVQLLRKLEILHLPLQTD